MTATATARARTTQPNSRASASVRLVRVVRWTERDGDQLGRVLRCAVVGVGIRGCGHPIQRRKVRTRTARREGKGKKKASRHRQRSGLLVASPTCHGFPRPFTSLHVTCSTQLELTFIILVSEHTLLDNLLPKFPLICTVLEDRPRPRWCHFS